MFAGAATAVESVITAERLADSVSNVLFSNIELKSEINSCNKR